MKLVKSLLLSAPAAVMAFGVANAADLPSRKSAPVSYVKICDAYGAGFFYIPGTDTCLKVGGYVRAEYSYSPTKTTTVISSAGTITNSPANTEDSLGWRARGRIDLDARTQTAFGTVRTVISDRLQSRSGLTNNAANAFAGAGATAENTAVEAAFVQFAGFTAGRAGENFSFFPGSSHYFNGSGTWASFPTGVKQLAYTATFGGGFSATIALEDRADFSNTFAVTSVNTTAAVATPNNTPLVAANLRLDQAWGSAQLMGAVTKNEATAAQTGVFSSQSVSKTGFAIGGGVKFNLPMLAAGDQLWLTAAYAEGINDLVGYMSSNNGDQASSLRGFTRNDNSFYVARNAAGAIASGQEKAYGFGAIFTHYWLPTLRTNLMASYGRFTPPSIGSLGNTFVTAGGLTTAGATGGGLSKATVYQLAANLIWTPVSGLDIGAEVAYRNLKQSVDATYIAVAPTVLGAVNPNEVSGRLRVQRSF